MTRAKAYQVSEALTAVGQSHTIVVNVMDTMFPRETYRLQVTPVLSYTPLKLRQLQELAAEHGCEVSYCNGSFAFMEAE